MLNVCEFCKMFTSFLDKCQAVYSKYFPFPFELSLSTVILKLEMETNIRKQKQISKF